jgi:hypothetical protein
MQTFEEKEKNNLIKKFHILLIKADLDDNDKKALLRENYGVESSKDLTVKELMDICNKLQMVLNPKLMLQDRLRKRVIAAIGKYLDSIGQDRYDIEKIKHIACRASKCKDFNAINETKLRSIYNAFIYYKRGMNNVMDLTDDLLTNKTKEQ